MSLDQLANNYCYFLEDDAFSETGREGFRHRIINGENLQLCFWRIADGSTGSFLHRHDESEQLGIVMRGALDFRIGDANDERRTVLRAGDVYLAPTNIWHGDSIFIGDDEYGECWILDVFSPLRTDLIGAPQRTVSTNASTKASTNGMEPHA